MAASELINLSSLLDDAKCFELIRQHRWPSGVRCSECGSASVVRNGHDEPSLIASAIVATVVASGSMT